jgi:hypothetical protein
VALAEPLDPAAPARSRSEVVGDGDGDGADDIDSIGHDETSVLSCATHRNASQRAGTSSEMRCLIRPDIAIGSAR